MGKREIEIITATEVQERALDSANFDPALVRRFILPAQRFYIRPFLGEDLYDDILKEIEENKLSSHNKDLVEDYLKNALAFFVLYDSFDLIRVNVTSAGVVINETETSEVAGSRDAASARRTLLTMGERWLEHARFFIKDVRDEDDSNAFDDFCDDNDRNSQANTPIIF